VAEPPESRSADASTPVSGPLAAAVAAAGLQPLRVSGVVVDKAALIEALRIYLPGLSDIVSTEDGDHFWLMLRTEQEDHDAHPLARDEDGE
jgi:hypothetical protein